MSALTETRKQGLKTLITIAIIGVSLYLGFTPLFELVGSGVAGRIVGATFGSIFAILMTMYLLNKQTEIEQESKKGERVFDEKVGLYQKIIEEIRSIVKDGKISSEEMTSLPFTMIHLQMIGGDVVLKNFSSVFEKINEIFESSDDDEVEIPNDQIVELFSLLGKFSVECRVDLGISNELIKQDVFDRTINAVEKSNETVKGKRDTTKFKFQGKQYGKGRLVLAVLKNYVEQNKDITFEQLKEAFPNEWLGRSRNSSVFAKLSDAESIFAEKGKAKHFIKPTEVIQLSDEKIAVSRRWSIKNIMSLVDGCNSAHKMDISH